MKLYIVGCTVKPEFKVAVKSGETVPNDEMYDIFYNENPVLAFPTQEMAETELRLMLPVHIRLGSHYCQLEVEQVAEDKYAIVCNDHPDRHCNTA
jgi:hypothetical protein